MDKKYNKNEAVAGNKRLVNINRIKIVQVALMSEQQKIDA